MNNVTFLLLTLFSITITEPKIPAEVPRLQRPHVIVVQQEAPKTLFNMTNAELSALSVKKKAKLVKMTTKSFKEMTKVVNHEAGPKMNDKILVAAVIFNRVHYKQFKNSVIKVINEPGQFYDVKHTRSGSSKDKKAQLAILLAYRDIELGKIPHDVLYFNSISYKTKNPKRFVKYKHYNNYFIRDSKCKCKWCKEDKMGQSRNEDILENMLGAQNPLGEPQSREEALLMQLLEKLSVTVLKWLGVTTTELEDGDTTNPIIINSEEVTAVAGDVVTYSDTEFAFNGTAWQEFGGVYVAPWVDITGTLEAGQTSITLNNSTITTSSTIEVFDEFDVPYVSKTVSTGSITLTFDAQDADMIVKVRIS